MSKHSIDYQEFDDDEFDYDQIITEDDEPVDNIFSEKEQRLLTESLITSWEPGRKFVPFANVGIFYDSKYPPIIPDMFLSLDVQLADDIWEKKHRSYFIRQFGKPPEIAVEIVSNKKGGENTTKMTIYQRIGVLYYVVYDPQRFIQKDPLRIYELMGGQYIPQISRQLQRVGLGVMLWDGVFEERHETWLRWCDHEGKMILTGKEKSEAEKIRADQAEGKIFKEWMRAEQERQRAEQERQRADLLEAKLRSLRISLDG